MNKNRPSRCTLVNPDVIRNQISDQHIMDRFNRFVNAGTQWFYSEDQPDPDRLYLEPHVVIEFNTNKAPIYLSKGGGSSVNDIIEAQLDELLEKSKLTGAKVVMKCAGNTQKIYRADTQSQGLVLIAG